MSKKAPQEKRPHPDTLDEKMNLDLYYEKGLYGNEKAAKKSGSGEGRGPYQESETRDRIEDFSYRDTENADWNTQEESDPRKTPRKRMEENKRPPSTLKE